MEQKSNKKKVIIIGAGSAGLAAGQKLLENNYDIQIFEARSIIGGRVGKLENWADYPIELGAEELHYSDSWYGKQLRKIEGLKWHSDENTDDYFQHPTSNKMIEEEEFEKKYDTEILFDYFIKQYKQDKLQDISMKQFIEQQGKMIKQYNGCEHVINAQFACEFGTNLDKISIKGLGKDAIAYVDDNQDENWYIFSGKTHIDVYQELFKNAIVKVQLNTPIKQIRYRDNNSDKITIRDINDKQYQGDYVICCVPITQLQNNKIIFKPQLPQDIIQAINTMQMDHCIKLHIKFKEKFWKKQTKDIIIKGKCNFLWESSDERSQSGKCHILGGLLFGEQAKDFESNKQSILNEILENLSLGYELNVKDLYEDLQYFDWGQEKYIEGGYTWPIIGEGNSREILRQNVDNKIFFAGEHCSENFFATIHGALQTGIDSAEQIIKLNKN